MNIEHNNPKPRDFLKQFITVMELALTRGEETYGASWLNYSHNKQKDRIKKSIFEEFDKNPVDWGTIASYCLIGWIRDRYSKQFPR